MLTINKYSSQDIYLWKNTNIICLYVKIENNILTYDRINNNYQDRGKSIIQMIKDTLNIYKINNLEIYINLMDMPINNPYFLQFSKTTNCPVNTIPNFSFYEWEDVKLNKTNSTNFFVIKESILKNNIDWDDKLDKIMWSGSSSHEIRKKFNIYKNHEFYEYNLCDLTKKYYALHDHTKYKYLLDLEGVGYSGRFPYLALTGSCVILIENTDYDRDYKLYYDEYFIEDVHYIKVCYNSNEEISSIHEKILDKIKMNDCKKIGENCKQVAINLFTKDNILLYMSNILNYYAKYYEINEQCYNSDIKYTNKYINDKIKKRLIKRFNN